MTSRPPNCAGFDITKYKASYADKQRLKDIEMVPSEDGGVDIIDHSPEPFQPTDRQQEYIDILFDPENPAYLDLQKAAKALDPPGGFFEVRRWCNTSVQFTAWFKQLVKERVELATVGSELMVAGTAEGDLKPDKDQKWAAKMLMKMQEFAHAREVRWVQINQTLNIGVNADMDDESLQKVIDGAGSVITKTASTAIEGGAS